MFCCTFFHISLLLSFFCLIFMLHSFLVTDFSYFIFLMFSCLHILCCTLPCRTNLMLHSIQTECFSFYMFLMFNFSYCTFSLSHIYYNALILCYILPYCTHSMLHFFQVLLFYLALFHCSLLESFQVAMFSGGTNLCISLPRYFSKLINKQCNSNSPVSRYF